MIFPKKLHKKSYSVTLRIMEISYAKVLNLIDQQQQQQRDMFAESRNCGATETTSAS
jgi:hypothetical protein